MQEELLVSVGNILAWFKEITEQRKIVDAHTLVNIAFKLNALISDETDKLFDLQQVVATKRFNYINMGETVARAKARVEASDEYKAYCKQRAMVDRVEENIRLAKLMSRIKDNEMRNQ